MQPGPGPATMVNSSRVLAAAAAGSPAAPVGRDEPDEPVTLRHAGRLTLAPAAKLR